VTPIPRWLERLGGLFIFACSVWLTGFAWKAAHTPGGFLSVGAAGPGFALLGLALILFPGYKSERLTRGESLEGTDGWAQLTPRWKIVTLLAMLLSAGYFLVLISGR
jgi:membrane associated rhomboid family serine protease